jgi:hypothetical protein
MVHPARHWVLIAIAMLVLIARGTTTDAAIAVTQTLVATDTTFVDSILADTNFGTGFSSSFDTGRQRIQGNNYDERFGYNLFDLSVLPEEAEIKTAILRLFLEDVDGITGREALVLYSTTTEWNETGLTWNSQPTTWATRSKVRADRFFEDYAVGQTQVWTELDLLTLGQSGWWTDYLENNQELSIVQGMNLNYTPGGPQAIGPDEGVWVFDRTAARPELVITYEIPEPVTALLLGVGSLAILKRRHTSA